MAQEHGRHLDLAHAVTDITLMPMSTHTRGLLLAFAGVLCFTPDAVMFRLTAVSSATLLFWRGLLTVAALLLWVLATRPRHELRQFFSMDWLGVVAVFAQTASEVGFIAAIMNAPTADALVVLASSPLLAALVGWLVFRERIGVVTWLAIAAAVIGILITLRGTVLTGSLQGCSMALLAAAGWAVNLNCLRFSKRVDPLATVVLGTVLSGVIGLLLGPQWLLTESQFALLGLTGFVLHPISFGLIALAAKLIPSAEVSLISLVETLLGPFWVWLVLSEAPSGSTWIGGTVVMATLIVHTLLTWRGEREAVGAAS